jgi:hypothetical protein
MFHNIYFFGMLVDENSNFWGLSIGMIALSVKEIKVT